MNRVFARGVLFALLFVAATVFLARLLPAVLDGTDSVRSFVVDDGFYYLKIAENIAGGNGSTFDGESLTNGYQPLWMMAILPVAAVTRLLSPELATLTFTLWNHLCFLILVLLFGRLAAKRWPHSVLIGIGLLAQSKVISLFSSGVEAPLLAVLLIVSYAVFDRCPPPDEGVVRPAPSTWVYYWLFGLAAAGVVLARLDHLLVVLPMFAAIVLSLRHEKLGTRVINLGRAAAPGILLTVCYVGFNFWMFSTPLPVSGANKLHLFLSNQKSLAGTLLLMNKTNLALLCSPFVLLVFLAALRKLKRPSNVPTTLRLFLTGSALYCLFISVSVSDIQRWYLVAPVLSIIFFTCWAAETYLPLRMSRLIALILMVTAVASNYSRAQIALQSDNSVHAVGRFASWANSHLDSSAVVAVCDAGEICHVFSQRVINADGLVNDLEYSRAFREGLALPELRKRGATHLMTVFGHQVIEIDSLLRAYTLTSPMGRNIANTDTFFTAQIVHAESYASQDLGGQVSHMLMWRLD